MHSIFLSEEFFRSVIFVVGYSVLNTLMVIMLPSLLVSSYFTSLIRFCF